MAAAPGTADDDTRATLLAAIARPKSWVKAVMDGSATSFAEIAKSEDLAEKYVRFLASLAFLSPRIIEAIVDGNIRARLTLDALTRGMPMAWSEQKLGLRIAFTS